MHTHWLTKNLTRPHFLSFLRMEAIYYPPTQTSLVLPQAFIPHSGELRNEALQSWRGVVCFSGDFTFGINILNSISTPHEHSFFIIINVLSVSCDLPHPFLTFYFNPNLHHFINNTCNLIHFLSMTIDTKFMELIGVFLNYLRFVNYNVSC